MCMWCYFHKYLLENQTYTPFKMKLAIWKKVILKLQLNFCWSKIQKVIRNEIFFKSLHEILDLQTSWVI